MPLIEADFEHVDEPIPPGQYHIECTGYQIKQSKQEDHSTYVQWTLTITEAGDFLGRNLFYNSNLADNKKKDDGSPDTNARRTANYYLREFLKTFHAPFEPTGFDPETMLHKFAIAEVDQQEYPKGSGKMVANVKRVMEIPA